MSKGTVSKRIAGDSRSWLQETKVEALQNLGCRHVTLGVTYPRDTCDIINLIVYSSFDNIVLRMGKGKLTLSTEAML